MGLFRTSVDPDELRATLTADEVRQQETVYQASRGGHFPVGEKPVPGTPKEGPREH